MELNSPVLSWTRKIMKGNIEGIIKANEDNFVLFTKRFGKVDVIHAHVGYPGGYIAMRLSKKFGVPYVITEHMAPFPFDSYRNKNGEIIHDLKSSFQNASAIIAVSYFLKKAIEDALIKKVIFVPNLVDESYFIPNYKGNNKECFTFIFIGGLIERKGIDVLINAFSIISDDKKIKLKIIGEGILENYYKAYSKQKGVDHKIEWTGFLNRRQVVEEIQQADSLILSSRNENLPMVLLE